MLFTRIVVVYPISHTQGMVMVVLAAAATKKQTNNTTTYLTHHPVCPRAHSYIYLYSETTDHTTKLASVTNRVAATLTTSYVFVRVWCVSMRMEVEQKTKSPLPCHHKINNNNNTNNDRNSNNNVKKKYNKCLQ